MRYGRRYSNTQAYTLPSGRQATSREYRERMELLAARERCPDCKKAADEAVYSMETGISQCSAHRSYGR
jgi:hypothetical protein